MLFFFFEKCSINIWKLVRAWLELAVVSREVSKNNSHSNPAGFNHQAKSSNTEVSYEISFICF